MKQIKKMLAPGDIEIAWANGTIEVIATQGMVYNAGAIVLSIGSDKIIIPMTSVKHFRLKSA